MKPSNSSVRDDLVGTKPAVLVFAPSDRDPSFEEQQNQLLDGLDVLESHGIVHGRCLTEGASNVGGEKLTRDEAAALRQRFNIDAGDFCVLVLAAGGRELRRSDTPLKLDAVYEMIETE